MLRLVVNPSSANLFTNNEEEEIYVFLKGGGEKKKRRQSFKESWSRTILNPTSWGEMEDHPKGSCERRSFSKRGVQRKHLYTEVRGGRVKWIG